MKSEVLPNVAIEATVPDHWSNGADALFYLFRVAKLDDFISLINVTATASLQGTVNLNGSPSAGWVYLVPTGPSAQAVFSLHSGTSGTYTAAHLPPGSYQAIAFERRHSANYRDAASLAPYSNYVHTVTVNAGDKPTLNLDAVPVKEVTP